MAGILAVVVFALGFLLHGLGVAGNAWFDWPSLLLLGLALLALHLMGAGAGIRITRGPAQ